jgi:hypothetical protein
MLSAVAFAKGRLMLGALSLFVPVVGLLAAFRLAKPNSPWARRRYRGKHAHRLERARARYAPGRRGERLGIRVRNAIGGAPSPAPAEDEQGT